MLGGGLGQSANIGTATSNSITVANNTNAALVENDFMKLMLGGKRDSHFSSRLLSHGFSSGTSMQSEKLSKERSDKFTLQRHENIMKLHAAFEAELRNIAKVKKKLMDKQISLAYLTLCHFSSISIQAATRGFIARLWYKRIVAAIKIFKCICQYTSIKKDERMRTRLLRFFKMAKLRIRAQKLQRQALSEKRAAARQAKFMAAKAAAQARSVRRAAKAVISSSLLFGTRRVLTNASLDREQGHVGVIRRLVKRFYRQRRVQLLNSQYGKVVLYILSQKFNDRLVAPSSIDVSTTPDSTPTKYNDSSKNNINDNSNDRKQPTTAPSFLTQFSTTPDKSTPQEQISDPSDCNSFLSFIYRQINKLSSSNPRIKSHLLSSSNDPGMYPSSPHFHIIKQDTDVERSGSQLSSSRHLFIEEYKEDQTEERSDDDNLISLEGLFLPSWIYLNSVSEVLQFMRDLTDAGLANPDLFSNRPPLPSVLRSYMQGISATGKVAKHFFDSCNNKKAYTYHYDPSKKPPEVATIENSMASSISMGGLESLQTRSDASIVEKQEILARNTMRKSMTSGDKDGSRSGHKYTSNNDINNSNININNSRNRNGSSNISSSNNNNNNNNSNSSSNSSRSSSSRSSINVRAANPGLPSAPLSSMPSSRTQAVSHRGKGRQIIGPSGNNINNNSNSIGNYNNDSNNNSNNNNNNSNNNDSIPSKALLPRSISSRNSSSINNNTNTVANTTTNSNTNNSKLQSFTVVDQENDKNFKSTVKSFINGYI